MDEIQIQKMIESYKKKQAREKENYDAKKDMESFKESNRIKSKIYHQENQDKIKQRYLDNQEIINARNLYNYYKRKNNIGTFIEKHEIKYNMLKEKGWIT